MRNLKYPMRMFGAVAVMIMLLSVVLGSFYFLSGAHAQSAPIPVAPANTPRFVTLHANSATSHRALAQSKKNLVKTIPYWSSLFAYNGLSYPFQMVGTDPTSSSATTTVPVEIIPLNMVFSDGSRLNGAKKVKATVSSPLFQKATYTSGKTQYGDAMQRAEFWKYVKNDNYHVLLGQPKVYSTITLNVPAADGSVDSNPNTGQPEGLADINWFDFQIQGLMTSLHISPKTFPIFLSDDVFLYQGDPTQCCILGYHSAVPSTDATGRSVIQTYAWGTYIDPGLFSVQVEDINALSHEISEWYSDPFGDNITPTWISQIAPQYGCNNFLEVGDPLVGVAFTVNGYHPQDEAFYSWFAKQVPSIGIHGQYDYLGVLPGPSAVC